MRKIRAKIKETIELIQDVKTLTIFALTGFFIFLAVSWKIVYIGLKTELL